MCPMPEIFFGGARGGGKTDGVLGKWAIKEKRYGQHFNAVMFRKTTVSSEDAIERSKEIYGPLGGRFVGSPFPHWKMPNGGRVAFAYMESIEDANAYQGRNLTDAWVEEAGQYVDSAPIDRLFGVLRSAHRVPVQLILTANPGGAGQHWIRNRYELHPFPRLPKVLSRTLPTGDIHQVAVIPSRITDNKILLHSDPGYVGRLHMVGSAQLVKAWLEGDWTAIEGAYFDCWSNEKHVIRPFGIPKEWLRFRSGDWGSYSPFSIGWWTVVQDDCDSGGLGRMLPRGALVRYREWYGTAIPAAGGKGLKLTADQVAQGIASREADDPKLTYGVLDPSAFNEDGGPSLAERINTVLIGKKLISFREADNSRVPTTTSKDRRGAMGGWDMMRQRLIGISGTPMIYCFDTCTASIRTIPVLQHDPKKGEDLDTQSEDHAADEWRYACLSRPWLKAKPEPVEPRDGYRSAQDDYAEANESFKTI
jgi:terminase large subunit-like protein